MKKKVTYLLVVYPSSGYLGLFFVDLILFIEFLGISSAITALILADPHFFSYQDVYI